MSAAQAEARRLLEETRDLLGAAEAGAAERAATLADGRARTLERLARLPQEDFGVEARSLLAEVGRVDRAVHETVREALDSLRSELRRVREQRRALATLRSRGRGEPRFVSRRA